MTESSAGLPGGDALQSSGKCNLFDVTNVDILDEATEFEYADWDLLNVENADDNDDNGDD